MLKVVALVKGEETSGALGEMGKNPFRGPRKPRKDRIWQAFAGQGTEVVGGYQI